MILPAESDFVVALGHRIRAQITAAGYTQESFSEESGISRVTLSRICSGIQTGQLTTYIRIAGALKVSLPELLTLTQGTPRSDEIESTLSECV